MLVTSQAFLSSHVELLGEAATRGQNKSASLLRLNLIQSSSRFILKLSESSALPPAKMHQSAAVPPADGAPAHVTCDVLLSVILCISPQPDHFSPPVLFQPCSLHSVKPNENHICVPVNSRHIWGETQPGSSTDSPDAAAAWSSARSASLEVFQNKLFTNCSLARC